MTNDDDMRPEYDFSKGVPNRYARRFTGCPRCNREWNKGFATAIIVVVCAMILYAIL